MEIKPRWQCGIPSCSTECPHGRAVMEGPHVREIVCEISKESGGLCRAAIDAFRADGRRMDFIESSNSKVQGISKYSQMKNENGRWKKERIWRILIKENIIKNPSYRAAIDAAIKHTGWKPEDD